MGVRRGVRGFWSSRCSHFSTSAGGACAPRARTTCRAGRALLVANHAGILPWDATMIATALLLSTRCRATRASWCSTGPSTCPGSQSSCGAWAGWLPRPATRCGCSSRTSWWLFSPRSVKGTGEAAVLQRPPRAALRPRRLRRDRPAQRRADRAGGRGGQRGDLSQAGRAARAGALIEAPTSRSRPPFPGSGRSGECRCPRWRIEFCPPIRTASYGPEAARRPPNGARAGRTDPRSRAKRALCEPVRLAWAFV